MPRGRPRKINEQAVFPKKANCDIDEEQQEKLMAIINQYPKLTIHEVMIMGIEYLHDSLINAFR